MSRPTPCGRPAAPSATRRQPSTGPPGPATNPRPRTKDTTMTHADDLRAWARGTYTTEAATEMLLNAFGGRFAALGNPWVHAATTSEEGYQEHAWIDFASIPDEAGPLS